MQMTLFDTEVVDKIHEVFIKDLKRGSGFENGKKRIVEFFGRNLSKAETIKLLEEEYGFGGRSVTGYSQRHDSKGIKITLDKINNSKQYSWNQVHDAISKLINSGEYLEGEE